MLDSFFGVHPYVIRSGLWGKMRPGEKDLYIFLMEQSERRCTREIAATDAEISSGIGAASRTLCNARKRLRELGLIRFDSGHGNRYTYQICDPRTGQPYPGGPREPIVVPKRNRLPEQAAHQPFRANRNTAKGSEVVVSEPSLKQQIPVEVHGVRLRF